MNHRQSSSSGQKIIGSIKSNIILKSFLSFFKEEEKILFLMDFDVVKIGMGKNSHIFREKKTSQTNDDGKICDEKCTLVMHILCSSKATLILSAINYRKCFAST
jgi:hypothetical protein